MDIDQHLSRTYNRIGNLSIHQNFRPTGFHEMRGFHRSLTPLSAGRNVNRFLVHTCLPALHDKPITLRGSQLKIDDGSWALDPSEAKNLQRRPDAYGTRGMVCSAHPAAAFIGLSILQRGGNAFDAAIAVAAAEGVLLPMKCGLGGDAFVVRHGARPRE